MAHTGQEMAMEDAREDYSQPVNYNSQPTAYTQSPDYSQRAAYSQLTKYVQPACMGMQQGYLAHSSYSPQVLGGAGAYAAASTHPMIGQRAYGYGVPRPFFSFPGGVAHSPSIKGQKRQSEDQARQAQEAKKRQREEAESTAAAARRQQSRPAALMVSGLLSGCGGSIPVLELQRLIALLPEAAERELIKSCKEPGHAKGLASLVLVHTDLLLIEGSGDAARVCAPDSGTEADRQQARGVALQLHDFLVRLSPNGTGPMATVLSSFYGSLPDEASRELIKKSRVPGQKKGFSSFIARHQNLVQISGAQEARVLTAASRPRMLALKLHDFVAEAGGCVKVTALNRFFTMLSNPADRELIKSSKAQGQVVWSQSNPQCPQHPCHLPAERSRVYAFPASRNSISSPDTHRHPSVRGLGRWRHDISACLGWGSPGKSAAGPDSGSHSRQSWPRTH